MNLHPGAVQERLPRRFFVSSGSAISSISPLNAFDSALVKAGIGHCNLVSVSSILPEGCRQVEKAKIAPGAVTFCVMARVDGLGGGRIGAGLGWGFGVDSQGERYGLVAEAHGSKGDGALKSELSDSLHEMARIRRLKLSSLETKTESMEILDGKYGSVVVALIFVPE